MVIQASGQRTITTNAIVLMMFAQFFCGSVFSQSNALQPDTALYQRTVKLPGGRGATLYSEDPADEMSVVSISFRGRSYKTLEECDANLNWKRYPNLTHICFYQADVNATMLLYLGDLNAVTAIEFESSILVGDITQAFSTLKTVKCLSAYFSDRKEEDYSFLPALTGLESLALSEIRNVETLHNIVKCDSLRELYIAGSPIRTDVIPELSRLSRLKRISIYGLMQPKAIVQEILKMGQIESISLTGTFLDAEVLRNLTSLGHLNDLEISVLSSATQSSDVRKGSKIRRLRVEFPEREIRTEMFEFISGFKELEEINWIDHDAFPSELRALIQDRRKKCSVDLLDASKFPLP